MNPFPVQEGDPPLSPPKPIEGLHEIGPPPFLVKTFEIVEDPSTDHIVSWNRGGTSLRSLEQRRHQLLKQRDTRVKELEDEAAERGRGSSVSELEALALEMQGYGKQKNVKEEEDMVVERELDDGFWEELLSNEGLASTSSN